MQSTVLDTSACCSPGLRRTRPPRAGFDPGFANPSAGFDVFAASEPVVGPRFPDPFITTALNRVVASWRVNHQSNIVDPPPAGVLRIDQPPKYHNGHIDFGPTISLHRPGDGRGQR
jgi:hypothetical protein